MFQYVLLHAKSEKMFRTKFVGSTYLSIDTETLFIAVTSYEQCDTVSTRKKVTLGDQLTMKLGIDTPQK